jgi:hypothetical protein
MNKNEANDLLRFCIKIIRGEVLRAPFSVVLGILIENKEDLVGEGFWWQSRILDYWIHRFQGEKGFLRATESPDPTCRIGVGGNHHEFIG